MNCNKTAVDSWAETHNGHMESGLVARIAIDDHLRLEGSIW